MNDYCPGAVQVPQANGGELDTSLPPRAVWHITWDQLRPDGSQPDFGVVAGYLQRQGYCPHLMWNPFTGYIEQYYPASQSARALKYNNQDGEVCVQIEVFFTPGCVVDGVKYNTVAETPLKGWDTIVSWLESLGVPRVWPMGSPQWNNNSRDVATWNGNAGHYGHCNSPGDDHTDPGPMPDLGATPLADTGQPTTEEEDEEMMYVASPGDGKLWLCDGIRRWHIPDPATHENIMKLAGWGVLKVFKNGAPQTAPAIGAIVKDMI